MKNALKSAPPLFVAFDHDDLLEDIASVIGYTNLGEPEDWATKDYVVEYKAVAVHRIVPSTAAKFVKETK